MLQNLNKQELKEKELNQIIGGNPAAVIIGAAGAVYALSYGAGKAAYYFTH